MSDSPAISPNRKFCIFDYFFFLRPILHPPVWTIAILGFFASPVKPEYHYCLYWLLFFSSSAAAWAFVINQIGDIETDRINNKLYFLPLNLISIKSAYAIAVLLALATLASFLILGKLIGLLFTFGLLLGYFYSGKPFNWKNNPVLGTISNAIAHGAMPFIAGYLCAGGRFTLAVSHSLPYIFAVIAVYIGTTIPDIDGDKKSGKITPGVALGVLYASAVMLLSLMAAILSGLILWDIPFLIAANLAMPFYIYSLYRPGSKSAILSVKSSVLFLSIAACIRFWPYTIALIILFVITKWYYKWRLNIDYPSFT
jgi:4-hydroxybenzoate polyprenyltransferase